MQEYTVKQDQAGQRADVFLASKYATVDKAPIKPSYKLKLGEKIAVNEEVLHQKPPIIDLPIIYEDNDVVVMNKPAGVLTHSKGALNIESTVASFIAPVLQDMQG